MDRLRAFDDAEVDRQRRKLVAKEAARSLDGLRLNLAIVIGNYSNDFTI
jgi:hypothetical protein